MNNSEHLRRIGASIKKYRLSKGLSQTQLAYLCDFERQNMYSIEAGKKNVTIETLLKIAKALNVKVRDLIDF